MLRALVESCLRHRGVVIALAALVAGAGGWSATHADLDVFPDFVPPEVVVQTEAPGLAPEEVEALVTMPIESAIGGLSGLESLRSESTQGLSVVTVVFRDGTDVLAARQLLAESLAEASARLPPSVEPPHPSPLTSSTMDVLKLGLVSERLSPMELRSLADWTVRPRLLMVPGVARVNVFGGQVRELQVQVHPAALRARGLALGDALSAARDASAIRGAGFIDTANQRVTLETAGEAASARELARALIAQRAGAPLELGAVARVAETAAPRFGDARIQGKPGVLLTLSSQYGANTLEVTRRLERALADLEPLLAREGVSLVPALHRPANFIESALRNLRFSLLLGGCLVAVVLLLFLRDPRTAFISVTAIPLSLLSAVIVLHALGASLNAMTLGGLAIAIGEVVDDAIIDVENIVRRLRENEARGRPRAPIRVVLEASLEVRRAVVYATWIVALVFLPLLTLGGLQGRFFAPLAESYLLAVLSSLGVALTLTPALALALLGRGLPHPGEPWLQSRLKAHYGRLLARVDRRPALVMAVVGLCCAASAVALPFLGGEFLPAFREHHLVLQVWSAPGTALDETLRIGDRISRALLALPAVQSVEQQAGRAEQGEDPWGPNRSEFHVELDPAATVDEAETSRHVRALLDGFPGVQSEVLTFLGDRISETITGEAAEVVVNLFGDDLDVLDDRAHAVAEVLAQVRGAVDVRAKAVPGGPRLAIELHRDALARFGFRPLEVLDQVQAAYEGAVVGQSHRGSQSVDVRVLLDAESRRDPRDVANLVVRGSSGALLPLRQLADVRETVGRDAIFHEGGRRRQTVTCNVSGRDVASFAAEAERRVRQQVSLPAGFYAVFGGTAQARAEARWELLLRSLAGALGVVILLSIVARHPRNLLLLLVNVPLALVGGVLAVAAAPWLGAEEGGLSLGSLVGFVTLFGITMRNSIMLVSHFQHLVEREGMPWGREAALRGAAERVVPITMTALVTGLGLLPLALGANRAGGEIDGPMAIVILGGLVTSSALNLLVLPALCLRYGRFAPGEARLDGED